jgi:hypothetical protein
MVRNENGKKKILSEMSASKKTSGNTRYKHV